MKLVIRSKEDVERLMGLIKQGPSSLLHNGSNRGGLTEDIDTYDLVYLNEGIWLGGGWGAWVHLAWDHNTRSWHTWMKSHRRGDYTVPTPVSEVKVKEILWRDRKSVNRFLKDVEWRD